MKKMIFLISLCIASWTSNAQMEISTIAELRAQQLGEEYIYVGEAIITFTQSFRNQKFLEDDSAGILIDDTAGIISSTYEVNDAITGIRGILTEFGGMRQFQPVEDPGAAVSSDNNLAPQIVSLATLSSDPEAYESELIQLNNVIIDVSPNTSWIVFTEYSLFDDAGSFTFRTSFSEVDYLGEEISIDEVSLVGIITERNNGDYFFTSRDSEDLEVLSLADYEEIQVSAYPNPVIDILNIDIRNQEQNLEFALIEGTTGKILSRELLSNQLVNKISMTNYSSGLYFYAIYDKKNRNVLVLEKLIKR